MIESGAEAVGSMGSDTPLAVLSRRPTLLYNYFSQLFAQVTNPPIDPIRERLVMSLFTVMGWKRNLLGETPTHAEQLTLDSPLLLDEELLMLKNIGGAHQTATLSTCWQASAGPQGLAPALRALCAHAERAIDQGARIIILSDRAMSDQYVAIPALLVIGALHHHLIRSGKRMKASFVSETGEARDVHQIACLIGYGCSAVNPYLAIQTIRHLHRQGKVTVDFPNALLN
jgi:hypothetical protein